MGEEVKFAFVDPTFRELALDGLEEGGGEGVRELVLMEVKMAMLDLMRVMVKMCPMEAFVGDEGEGRMLRQQLRLISSTTRKTYTGRVKSPSQKARRHSLKNATPHQASHLASYPDLMMLQSLLRTTTSTAATARHRTSAGQAPACLSAAPFSWTAIFRPASACLSAAPFSSRSSSGGGRKKPSPPPSTQRSRQLRPPSGARGAGRAVYDYLLLFKPFNVLCQFSAHEGKRTLADVLPPTTPRDVYPVGRLDYDSEGFVLLTNDTAVNHRMLDPAHEHEREYLVQVEGEVTEEGLSKLREGGLDLNLGQGKTHRSRPCPIAECITLPEGEEAPPGIGLREPPIRARKFIPTSWLRLGMTEGKNRQVRRMMAMVGFPCLRLVRWRVEKLDVAGLVPGEMRVLTREETYEKLKL